MNVTYFKRYRMEIGLDGDLPPSSLPEGFSWAAWEDALMAAHAEVKFHSFFEEIDTLVFANLADRQGCFRLMREIRGKPGFLPEATWLAVLDKEFCGTVQGVRERGGWGAIQNLGVIPAHRGRGLGSALLLKALEGFYRAGLKRAFLEVTAKNEAAVQMYRRAGFRCRKTFYKAVDVEDNPRWESGLRNQESGIRSQESGVGNQESGMFYSARGLF